MSDVCLSSCSGRKIRMIVEENGNITVDEYLEVGQRHQGTKVSVAGFYTLWQEVRKWEKKEE